MQTTSCHLPALTHRSTQEHRADSKVAKPSYLQQKDLSGMTYQCPYLNDTKAQPFPTPPYQLPLDISEKVTNLHPPPPPTVQPSGCREYMNGQGITPGWSWVPQGIQRCLWQEVVHCVVPNSCCLQLFIHPSPLPYSLTMSSEKSLRIGYRLGRKLKEVRFVEFHIRPSVEETLTRNNSKSTDLFSNTDL